MKALYVAALFSVAMLMSLPMLADTGFLDRSITLRGRTYAYQVYVPANYSPSIMWPVIMYLHGNQHQGEDGMRQTNAAFADSVREHRSWFPAIVVFPQASTGNWWFAPDMQEMALAELDQTVAEFHGDPSRMYLTGFSMGGTGSYCLAYHHNRFAALLVVAGRVEAGANYTAKQQEIDRKANAFMATPDPFASLAASLKAVPIWILHGSADEVISVEQSRRLVAALKNQGVDVKYTEYPGVKHVEAAREAYFDEAVIEWMFQQRKPKSP